MRRFRDSGFTLVELLVAMSIFVMILVALSSQFITASRGYDALTEASQSLQDTQAAIELMQYEISLAGYRGVGDDYDKDFSVGDNHTLVLRLSDEGDAIETRYFEDDTYLPDDDDGERVVRYYVDSDSNSLNRVENGQDLEMTGNVVGLSVESFIRRNQTTVPVRTAGGAVNEAPSSLAAIDLTLEFSDGRSSTFAISLDNAQSVDVQVAE